MSFSIKKSDDYSWPVEVFTPASGKRYDKDTFDVTFKRLTASRIQGIQNEIKSGDIADDRVLVRELVTGWNGVLIDGAELPYSESALAQLLEVPGVAAAIVQAWFTSIQGAPRKN